MPDASFLATQKPPFPTMMERPPLKVSVAPNGARRNHADHPNLPISIEEIAVTARECYAAGADEIHLHVRDAQGAHSLDPDLYRDAMAAIAQVAPAMTIQITTESAGLFDVPTQMATLQNLRPSAASVSVREILRSPSLARNFYGFAHDNDILIQHILYDTADAALLMGMIDQGIVPTSMRDVILVTGQYHPPRPAQPSELPGRIAALNGEFPNWTMCAFGQNEHAVAEAAIQLGGHVRIGFENNLHRPDGTFVKNNAENIGRIVDTAHALGCPLLREVNH